MQSFNKPENLNGAELRIELRAAGVEIADFPGGIRVDENTIYLDIKEDESAKAQQILSKHNGTTSPKEPSAADKLAAAGLTVDDLKQLLGL